MKKELLEYSYKEGLSHIPSALSMLDYVDYLFTNELVTPDDHIVIGKPFGAQAYYLVWGKLGYIDNIEQYSMGLKHDEIDFVDYSEETIGNALGIASGIAIASNKLIWVNLTDATLQMGNTLEAIQFIGHHCQNNILVTIDFNDQQVVGTTSEILTTIPVINMFADYGWDVHTNLNNFYIGDRPKVFVMNTIKGDGCPTMINNMKEWHYNKISSLEELQMLMDEVDESNS